MSLGFKHKIAAAAALSLAALAGAQAAVVTYTDRATWTAATLGVSNIDFEGVAPAGGSSYYAGAYSTAGVSFSDSRSYLFVVDPAYFPQYYDWGSGAVMLGSAFGKITVTLTGANALGMDLMSIVGFGATMTLGLSSGETLSVPTANYPNRTFFGLTSDSDITSITISAGSAYPELDNFSFGRAAVVATVPEPGSVLLAGLAIAALGLASRRRPG